MACYNACNHNAIDKIYDRKGFIHPKVDETKCVNCGLCSNACPVLKTQNRNTQNLVYAGWIKDDTIRQKSSSGGLFYALSCYCIGKGGVVFGAQYAEDYKSVEHGIADSINDIEKLMTSKYVQSDINNSFRLCKQYLLGNRVVLFSGTPCQIAGLRAYLRKDYDNLITIDIVCHGVPSPGIYKDYMDYLEKTNQDKINNVNFRLKKPRWGNTYLFVGFEKATPYLGSEGRDPFFIWSNRNYSLRDCCHHCEYTSVERVSDITIADFWGFLPRSFKETSFDKGTSLVLINTPKGEQMVKSISSKLYLTERTIKEAIAGNQMLQKTFETPKDIDSFWCDYSEHGVTALFNYGEPYKGSSKIRAKILRIKRKYGFLLPASIKNIIKNN